jgi:hypothetical protein
VSQIFDRRHFLLSTAALFACDKKKTAEITSQTVPSSTSQQTKSTPVTQPEFFADWKDLSFAQSKGGPTTNRALVLVPKEPTKAPRLVALHGYGESQHGIEFGAKGWRDQYEMDRVHSRLLSPPLVLKDSKDLETQERLDAINASLQKNPYQGLVIACPYTPSLKDNSQTGSEEFADYVIHQLLPRVQEETSCLSDRASTGINGVSMGGRLSLLVGFAHPEVFGVIGSLQTAMRKSEAPMFTSLAKKAYEKSPFLLRLVSSEEDPFLEAMTEFHENLKKEKIPHDFYVTPGPHDYIWNKGPGAIEMMTWHERVERGLNAP